MKCVLPNHSVFDLNRTSKEYELLVLCDCGEPALMVEWHTKAPEGWAADQWQRVRKSVFLALNGSAKAASDA